MTDGLGSSLYAEGVGCNPNSPNLSHFSVKAYGIENIFSGEAKDVLGERMIESVKL